jgi:hypothetical protein
MKANESKVAFIGFHFLSSIFPNQDFSKGYARKNRIFFSSFPARRSGRRRGPSHILSLLPGRSAAIGAVAGLICDWFSITENHRTGFRFRQENVDKS